MLGAIPANKRLCSGASSLSSPLLSKDILVACYNITADAKMYLKKTFEDFLIAKQLQVYVF